MTTLYVRNRSHEYVVQDGEAMAANPVETVKADSPRHEKGRKHLCFLPSFVVKWGDYAARSLS